MISSYIYEVFVIPKLQIMSEQNDNPCFICYDTECRGVTYFYPSEYSQISILHEMQRLDNSRDVIIKCKKCGKPNLVKVEILTDPIQQGRQNKPGWGHK